MPPTTSQLDGRPCRRFDHGANAGPETVFHANAPPPIKRRDVAPAALRMARTSAFVPRAAVVRPVPSPRRSWLRLFAFRARRSFADPDPRTRGSRGAVLAASFRRRPCACRHTQRRASHLQTPLRERTDPTRALAERSQTSPHHRRDTRARCLSRVVGRSGMRASASCLHDISLYILSRHRQAQTACTRMRWREARRELTCSLRRRVYLIRAIAGRLLSRST